MEATEQAALRPRRCFLSDLQRDIGDESNNNLPTKIRVMGTLIAHQNSEAPAQASADGVNGVSIVEIVLDDGTSCLSILVPGEMACNVSSSVGQTLECIARRIDRAGSANTYSWVADTLLVVSDPNLEALRWAELSCRDKLVLSSTDSNTDDALFFDLGYPCQPITPNELLQLIQYQASSTRDTGVTVEELSLVLQCPEPIIRDLVDDLQVSGLVYQNQASAYVPL